MPQVVGRERDLTILLDHLTRVEGLPATAVVVGEPGIGKTSVSIEVVDEARRRGFLCLACRPSEAEARFSFAALADLFRGVIADVAPQLPTPQRRALEGALALAEPEDDVTDDTVVAFAVLSSVRVLTAHAPLLLAVDDAQWLDSSSMAILQYVLSRMDDLKVASLLTVRDAMLPWMRRIPADERLVTVELGPLSVGAIREILREQVHVELARPALVRIWELSRGNPFFAIELARTLQRRGGKIGPGEEVPFPADLQGLVQNRLDGLDPDGLAVTRVVALLAEPTTQLVEDALGNVAAAGISAALDAGLLEADGERLAFAHPLLRSAVAAGTDPVERRRLHARLGELAPNLEQRARHLALGARRPDRAIAAVLDDAAVNLRARAGAAAAAELAELAVRLTPPSDIADLRRRVLSGAGYLADAGDGPRAIKLLEGVLSDAPAGAARARLLARIAHVEADFVGLPAALEHYVAALAEARGDDAVEAEIHLNIADLVRLTHQSADGLQHAELAVEAASRTDDAALRCDALATYGLLHFRFGLAVPTARMEEALALERTLPEKSERAVTWTLVHQLLWSGELDRARQILSQLRRDLRARESSMQEDALWYLALVEWRAGDWDAAARYAEEGLEVRAEFGMAGAQAVAELPAALIAAHRGHVDEARLRSERALQLAESEGTLVAQSGHRAVLGFIELSQGDAVAALRYLLPGWDMRDRGQVFEPGHRLELADTLEALIAVGELDEAERRVSEWHERCRALDRSWGLAITARCQALLCAARGRFDDAEERFECSLSEHARTQDPFQHARTLLGQGVSQRRARRRGAARATLEQALAAFQRVGAPLWAAKAHAELGRIGGRRPSATELTEGERRIAELVAQGRSNRQVASDLFITEHTVEAALTRAYQKLGLRSRTELAAWFAERRGEGPKL